MIRYSKLAKKVTMASIVFYIFLIVICQILSFYNVDEAFKFYMYPHMKENDCSIVYKAKKANPINIFNFFYNYDYWMSDFRVDSNVTNKSNCLNLILKLTVNYKTKPIRISVVDNNSNVVSSFIFK